MRHQHGNRHVLEQFAADAAEQGFAQRRMMVSAADDHVGRQIGDAREQDVRDGEATAQRLLWLGRDPMMGWRAPSGISFRRSTCYQKQHASARQLGRFGLTAPAGNSPPSQRSRCTGNGSAFGAAWLGWVLAKAFSGGPRLNARSSRA